MADSSQNRSLALLSLTGVLGLIAIIGYAIGGADPLVLKLAALAGGGAVYVLTTTLASVIGRETRRRDQIAGVVLVAAAVGLFVLSYPNSWDSTGRDSLATLATVVLYGAGAVTPLVRPVYNLASERLPDRTQYVAALTSAVTVALLAITSVLLYGAWQVASGNALGVKELAFVLGTPVPAGLLYTIFLFHDFDRFESVLGLTGFVLGGVFPAALVLLAYPNHWYILGSSLNLMLTPNALFSGIAGLLILTLAIVGASARRHRGVSLTEFLSESDDGRIGKALGWLAMLSMVGFVGNVVRWFLGPHELPIVNIPVEVFTSSAYFIVCIVVLVGLLEWVRRNRDKQHIEVFAVYVFTVLMFGVLQLLEVAIPGTTGDLYVSYLIELSRALFAASFLYFALLYSGNQTVARSAAGRGIIGAAILYLFTFTAFPPVAGELTFTNITVSPDPYTAVKFAGVNIFHTIAQLIGFGLAIAGTLLILSRFVRSGAVKSWQTLAVVSTVFITILWDAILWAISVSPGVYSTVGALTVNSVIIVAAVYRYDIFDYVPVARSQVFDTVEDAVLVINPKGKITDYNAAAEAMFPGIQTSVAMSEVLPDAVVQKEAVLNLQNTREEVSVVRDGDEKYYDIQTSVVEESDREVGTVLIVRDITTLRQRTQDLERQTEQLDQFASVVSHDLRNPLAIAETKIGQVQYEREDDKLEESLEALDRMDEMIDDALTLAREGRAIEETDWVSFPEMADEAWSLSDTAEASFEKPGVDEHEILCDDSRLQTLFENLFRNSVDHGPNDVTVRAGVFEDEGGFYVEDTGPGIPEDERDEVLKEGYTTDEDGTGFGLSIVSSIAAGHDWDVEVTESPEGGARFAFTGAQFRTDD